MYNPDKPNLSNDREEILTTENPPEAPLSFYDQSALTVANTLKDTQVLGYLTETQLEKSVQEMFTEAVPYKDKERLLFSGLRTRVAEGLRGVKNKALAVQMAAMVAGSFNISEIKPVYADSPAASYAGETQHHIYGGSEVIELKRYRVPNAEEKKVIDWLKEEVDEATIERVWKLKSARSKKERENRRMNKVPRMEELSGFKIPKEAMEKILSETFPSSMVSRVNSVKYINRRRIMDERYGMLKEGKPPAETVALADRDNQEIVFFATGNEIAATSEHWVVSSTVPHELAHLNDWDSNTNLTPLERLELLKAIVKRVKSEDRVRYVYVEEIQNKDKKIETSIKAGEYFAELFRDYVSDDPEIFSSRTKEDNMIVENFIKKLDPDFNVEAARQKRNAIASDLYYKSHPEKRVKPKPNIKIKKRTKR